VWTSFRRKIGIVVHLHLSSLPNCFITKVYAINLPGTYDITGKYPLNPKKELGPPFLTLFER
jgi:hypothetical protein